MSIKKIDHIANFHKTADLMGLGEQERIVLTKIMRVESNAILNAKNGKSSATGLFQFIDETWNKYADKHPDIDRTDSKNGDGRLKAEQQHKVGILFTRDNSRALTEVLGGRPPSAGNIYLAHFAGAGGATSVLKADPKTPLDTLLSAKAMSSNAEIYLATSDGKRKYFKNFTAGDLITWADRKMEQPESYEVMSVDERSAWRKKQQVSSDTPDAYGELKGFLEVILDVVKNLFQGAAKLFTPAAGISYAGNDAPDFKNIPYKTGGNPFATKTTQPSK